MLRSLFSGISGLRAHQTMMDVVGNNITNVNTAGYKSSSTVFEDNLSQLLKAAGAPQGGNGGTNPAAVGLGVRLGGISTNFGQGANQLTGRSTDLAIQGDGFFAVRQGGETLYTRAGAFDFDESGLLVTTSGAVVRGWMAQNGVVNPNAAVEDIRVPLGTLLAPEQTTRNTLAGNLPLNAAVPMTVPLATSVNSFDGQGTDFKINWELTKTAANTWEAVGKDNAGATLATSPPILFDPATGKLASPNSFTFTPPGAGWTQPITVDLTGLSQFGDTNTLTGSGNGSEMGALQSFTISPTGSLIGVFSNGLKQPLGQVALAAFNNPPGLAKVGGSMYRTTVNSGVPQFGLAGTGGRGSLTSGSLEMSNVDLAQEFTNLIVAQRGFQANSRVISASDEILQDLVNLKR
ncbi:MAG: flagellar hook protein FlgE [Actinomycetota bacterium]|nr:flagellar hook protein FlgE [Actinomycetota bacterium]